MLNLSADCFIPEFWVTRYPPTSVENQDLHCMVGFMAGESAAAAAAMRPSEVVRQTLAQLDRMFGAPRCPRRPSASVISVPKGMQRYLGVETAE